MSIGQVIRRVCPKVGEMLKALQLEWRVCKSSICYPLALRRVRCKALRGEKLRVLFVVTEVTKWKTQSLYDAMESSELFEPVVGISRPDLAWMKSLPELRGKFQEGCEFFRRKKMRVVELFDMDRGRALPISSFHPDIVFYQQAWFAVKGQLPCDVARFAITCYIPYFVPNYGDLDADCRLPNHRMFDFHFVLNEDWAQLYREATAGVRYAGEFVGAGHTGLDCFKFDPACGDGQNCVIYAPHWTIAKAKPMFRYSTFEWSGQPILEYAKKHPEIRWVFRPHPALADTLVKAEEMSAEQVERYYEEWRSVGEVSLGGDYAEIFNSSSALLTDCGSFLTEYAATGKPILHLISKDNNLVTARPSEKLYNTYYQIKSLEEMNVALDSVLGRREDPRRSDRLNAIREARLSSNDAASEVMGYLKRTIRGVGSAF